MLIVKVWHAKMQVLKVSQMMKELVNNVHPMGQFGLLNCIYQISQFVMNVITPNLSSIGRWISADSGSTIRESDSDSLRPTFMKATSSGLSPCPVGEMK